MAALEIIVIYLPPHQHQARINHSGQKLADGHAQCTHCSQLLISQE
jgi:hypothetical protein